MKVFSIFVGLLFSINTWAGPVWQPMPPEAYKFGDRYPEAQRLLYAFDYGHALVYERLLHRRGTIKDPEAFEKEILSEIMAILKNPPSVKVEEGDIAPVYVYKFPLTVDAFDWSHMLHQWVLDIMATSTDRGAGMDRRINEIFTQYKANRQLAITDVCKTMMFMDGHYFSKAFRRNFPSFNLLIWSYHWFQIKLYEALSAPTQKGRDEAVAEVLRQFREMISDLPDSAPWDMMPETAAEAPTFAAKHPRIAAAFDNNHMLHDVVSDILVSDKVTNADIRIEGFRTARMAFDPLAFKASQCPEDPR